MKSKFNKYEILIKISMIAIFCMSIIIGIGILNLQPNLDKIGGEWESIEMSKSFILKAHIIVGGVTLLFETILYKVFKLVRQINKKEMISKESNKILKSISRILGLYILVTIFTGQMTNILYISHSDLIYKNETLNSIMNSWLFNRSLDAIIIGTMIIILIILLEVLIEGMQIKEENDLTV